MAMNPPALAHRPRYVGQFVSGLFAWVHEGPHLEAWDVRFTFDSAPNRDVFLTATYTLDDRTPA